MPGGDLRPSGVERLRRYLPIVREAAPELPPEAGLERPRTRQDCLPGGCNQARPCPWVSCRYHLALEVHPDGRIEHRWPDLEAAPVTCLLDVVDALDDELRRREEFGTQRVELDRATVGHYLDLGKDMVRLIELGALHRIARTLRRGLTWTEDRFVLPTDGHTLPRR